MPPTGSRANQHQRILLRNPNVCPMRHDLRGLRVYSCSLFSPAIYVQTPVFHYIVCLSQLNSNSTLDTYTLFKSPYYPHKQGDFWITSNKYLLLLKYLQMLQIICTLLSSELGYSSANIAKLHKNCMPITMSRLSRTVIRNLGLKFL